MKIILDAGHGIETPGKRSPDGLFREYKYCREIMTEVKKRLEDKGFTVLTTVLDDHDVPLNARCRWINLQCRKEPNEKFLVVSIHNNAAGIGSKWMNARGWSVFIGKNASSKSKKLAESITKCVEEKGLKIRRPMPNLDYWQLSLAICRDTICPAVLTENFFLDNHLDVDYLISELGRKDIIDCHVLGILKYIEEIKKS